MRSKAEEEKLASMLAGWQITFSKSDAETAARLDTALIYTNEAQRARIITEIKRLIINHRGNLDDER